MSNDTLYRGYPLSSPESQWAHTQEQLHLRALKELGQEGYQLAIQKFGSALGLAKAVQDDLNQYQGPTRTATGSMIMGILKLDKYLPAEMAKTRGAEIEKILSDDAALHAIKELGPEFYARACERRGSAGVAEAARKELNRLHEAGTQVRDQGEIIIGVMNLTNLGLTVEEAKKRSAEIASITGSTIEAGATVAKPAELVTAVAKS